MANDAVQDSAMDLPEGGVSNANGVINGHEFVDLGLSVKWAICNVSTSYSEDYDNYCAWGETSTKSEYTVKNNKTYEVSMSI